MATVDPITATEDTYLNGNAATTNYGSGTTMNVYNPGGIGASKVALIRFPLSAIPNGNVTSAFIDLEQVGSTAPSYLRGLIIIREDWVEAEATYNIYKTGSNWGSTGASNGTTDYNDTGEFTLWYPGSATGTKTTPNVAGMINYVRNVLGDSTFTIRLSAPDTAAENEVVFGTIDDSKAPVLRVIVGGQRGRSRARGRLL